MAATVTYTTVNGEILHENRGGVESFYVPDPLGNTAMLVNTSGAVTDSWNYWPYGEVQEHGGTSGTPFTYVGSRGYYTDPSGSIYIRARGLEPDLSRWLTADPLWPSLPAYTYVRAQPATSVDALGGGVPPLTWPGWGPVLSIAHCIIEGAIKAGGDKNWPPKKETLLDICTTCCDDAAVAVGAVIGVIIGDVIGLIIGAVAGDVTGVLACGTQCACWVYKDKEHCPGPYQKKGHPRPGPCPENEGLPGAPGGFGGYGQGFYN